jgi:predicted O-linked N-acetylglucosamine transferase (SPINDLY family)
MAVSPDQRHKKPYSGRDGPNTLSNTANIDMKKQKQAQTQNLAGLLQQAVALHQQGQLAEAKVLYEQVLVQQPRNFDALHLSGVLAGHSQDFALAVRRFGQATDVNPQHADTHDKLGDALQELSRWDEARSSYERAIALHPDHAQAHMHLGNVLQELKRWDEALTHYDRAIAVAPNVAATHHNRGLVLQELQRWDEALASHSQALALKPDHANACINCGLVLQELQRWDEALASYDQTITIRPDFAEAYINRGTLLQKLQRCDEALASYDRAIALKSDHAEVFYNRGIVLQELKRWDEAIASYKRAIDLQSDFASVHYNLGNVLQEFKRWEEAAVHYARALALQPDSKFLLGTWLLNRSQQCEWASYDQDRQQLQAQLNQRQKVSSPFIVLALLDDPALQKSTAEIWVQTHHSAPSPLGPITPPTPDHTNPHPRKIRLAYYSADFHNHATAYLMAQLFECHDRNLFELYAFSFGTDSSDPMRQRLVAAFDHFIDVRSDTDQAIAQRSRDLGIDIAVDLKGYTRDSRPGIFACRSAPVQVNYLGYPGTMGADFMDYLIADKVVIPPESQEHYSEKIVYLPHSYQVNDSHRAIADTVWRKADLGLPEEGFVFCCFNNSYKITPQTFASWMRILQAVPASVLWLLGDNATAQRNLQQHAQAAGIDPSRLVFAPRMPLPEHLARHRAADLFLDTLPCNAHTTASDALWAGLPVLTQQGQSFAGRVAASLLTAVGLPELIVHTAQQYEDMAIAMAQDPQSLSRIKQKLAAQRDTAPLFNTKQLARHIEQAYVAMHARAQAGLAPQAMEIAGSA